MIRPLPDGLPLWGRGVNAISHLSSALTMRCGLLLTPRQLDEELRLFVQVQAVRAAAEELDAWRAELPLSKAKAPIPGAGGTPLLNIPLKDIGEIHLLLLYSMNAVSWVISLAIAGQMSADALSRARFWVDTTGERLHDEAKTLDLRHGGELSRRLAANVEAGVEEIEDRLHRRLAGEA
jgi:hypothetical protein